MLELRTLLSVTPLYWNPSGSSTWDTNPANTPWHTNSPAGPAVAWDNTGDYQAIFPAGGAATIMLGSDVTAASVWFAEDGYVITGSYTLTLAGDTDPDDDSSAGQNATVDVPQSCTATLDVPVAGEAGLDKIDEGTLILSQPNTYDNTSIAGGATIIDGGVVKLSGSGSLGPPSSGLRLDAGGTLDLNGIDLSTNIISGNGGTVIDSAGGATLTVTNGMLFGSMQFGNGNPITVNVTGQNNASIYLSSGATLQVNNGTLTNNGSIIWNGGASINLRNGAQLINSGTLSEWNGSLNVDAGSSLTNNSDIRVIGGSINQNFLSSITNNGNIYLGGGVDLSGLTLFGGTYLIYGYSASPCYSDLTVTHAQLVIQAELDVIGCTLNIDSDAILDDQGTLGVGSSDDYDTPGTIALHGGTLNVESGAQLNFSDHSHFIMDSGGSCQINGTVTVDGGTISTQATGSSTLINGNLYYSINLAAEYDNGEPVRLGSWTVDWGDGSTPDTYTLSASSHSILATHLYGNGITAPVVQISAVTAAFGNLIPLTLELPPSLIDGNPPAPANLNATESTADEVDLTWQYDTNLADTFIIIATAPDGSSTFHTVDSSTLSYAETGLTPDQNYTFSIIAIRAGTASSDPATITAAASAFTYTLTGPSTLSENGSGTLTINSSDLSQIGSCTITWRDGDIVLSNNSFGQTITPQPITDPYPTPGSDTNLRIASVSITDPQGYTFTLPDFAVTIVPAAPTNLFASTLSTSANEIDLSWNNISSFVSYNNIYISTDGTTFSYFDSVEASQNTYHATGLTPGTAYTFEVVAADANYDESTPSNTATATTIADPWHLNATGAATVAEGGAYVLTLSTSPISTAPTFGHWVIDWGDGSAVETITSENTTLSHVFASGTTSSAIAVSAIAADGATSSLTVAIAPVSMDVIPNAPTNLVATMFSSTEIDLAWTNNSNAATGINILRSDDGGTTFNVINTVDADTTNYDDTSLDPSETASYEIEAEGNTDNNISSTPATAPSVTTPTGLPTSFTAVQGPDNATSILVSWKYLGSDATGIELEMEDQSAGENFHTVSTNGATTDSTGKTTITFASLVGGDTYQFRMRADHADGSVSDYVTAAPVLIAQADSPTPHLTHVVDGSEDALRLGWSGALGGIQIQVQSDALPGNSQWYDIEYSNEAHSYWPTDFHGTESGWDYNNTFGNSDQGYVINPQVVGTGNYTYRIRSVDQYDNLTKWSTPVSATYTAPGESVSPVSLDLSSTDTSITATWDATEDAGTGPLLMQQDGVNASIGVGLGYIGLNYAGEGVLSDDGTKYTKTIGGLTPGTIYDFDLYTSGGDGDDSVNTAFTKESIATTGQAQQIAPNAPSNLKATWGVPKEQGVFLHWVDNSNNETAFKIYRYTPGTTFDPNNPGATGVYIGQAPADSNSFDYAAADPKKDMMYAVVAIKGIAPSAAATAEAVPPEFIAILRGDNSSDPLVNLVHESVAIGRFVGGKFTFTVAFTFGVEGNNPQTKAYPLEKKWLWWKENDPAGQFLSGIVYTQKSLDKLIFTIVKKKIVTHSQEEQWRKMMLNHVGSRDRYQVGAFDCTDFSNRVFDDAPGVEG